MASWVRPPRGCTMASPGSRRVRILFVAEAVTLAHVLRPLALARMLDPAHFEVHFACDPRCWSLLGEGPGRRWPLATMVPQTFLDRLRAGATLYRLDELERYVAADRELLRQTEPAVVVGDFRLSLGIAAPLHGVHYMNVTNAHWSPYRGQWSFPLPEHVLGRILGQHLGQRVFDAVRPAVFAWHARPVNRLRRRHGLPALGNLLSVYTQGDTVLYSDIPELAPTYAAPGTHHYLGPLGAQPTQTLPTWADQIPDDASAVYVNLGSSGRADLLPELLGGLAQHPGAVLAATAGRIDLPPRAGHIRVEKYLPGDWAAAHSAVVVCNGGSAPVYQALRQGTPVVGIASNLDQFLMMQAVERAGAGLLLRSGPCRGAAVAQAVERVRSDPRYRQAAQALARSITRFDPATRFNEILQNVLSGRAAPSETRGARAGPTERPSVTGGGYLLEANRA